MFGNFGPAWPNLGLMINFLLDTLKVLIMLHHLAKKSEKNIEQFSSKVEKRRFSARLGLIWARFRPNDKFSSRNLNSAYYALIFGEKNQKKISNGFRDKSKNVDIGPEWLKMGPKRPKK